MTDFFLYAPNSYLQIIHSVDHYNEKKKKNVNLSYQAWKTVPNLSQNVQNLEKNETP